MNLRNVLYLSGFIILSQTAGLIGSLFTAPAISTWYAELTKPSFTPPGWIFGPVWTVLYLLMGVAAFLVWRKGLRHRQVKVALWAFFGQLALNSLWSIIFFGLRNPGLAFAEIVVLWAAIIATAYLFFKVSKPAAWLLAPYLLWVSFAGFLNYSIWQISDPRQGVACTQEALLCPDGSSVGRSGPNCEFAACPGGVSLKTFTDPAGNTFQYPDGFAKKYIDALDWPPVISVVAGPLACSEAGTETARAGKTDRQIINGREYCVTKVTEGAAGSVYTQYAYAFSDKDRMAILTFSVHFIQCGNFDEPEKIECEAERAAFDINSIIDQIVRNIRFAPAVSEGV